MLRKCTEQEYKEYADFVYGLALDQSKSGYPTYCDGIKTKEMFMERTQRAFSEDTECFLRCHIPVEWIRIRHCIC